MKQFSSPVQIEMSCNIWKTEMSIENKILNIIILATGAHHQEHYKKKKKHCYQLSSHLSVYTDH